MDPAEFDGLVRQGPVDTLSVADAARQLDAVTRYVALGREDLDRREADGDVPALDAARALGFFRDAPSVSLTDDAGRTVAVVVSPAVLEVLEDALGLLQGEVDRLRGTNAPVTTGELRDQLGGRMAS
ncbi:hypothetical protein ABT354_30815 [Streptomyces sp. NPDC000594]|uniref:hypothetical protein n=1 Tax=Streptomyces sp. NPDC000594 TaxID=3154261 RepID=UPI00333115DA